MGEASCAPAKVTLGDVPVDTRQVVRGFKGMGAVDVVGDAVGDDGSSAVEPCEIENLTLRGLTELEGEVGRWVLGELEEHLEPRAGVHGRRRAR